MHLFLVGENITARMASYYEDSGRLTSITKGVYISSDCNIDEELLNYAFRITKYIYKNAYFIGYSAFYLTPTPDGKVFISGAKNSRNRLRSLEIIQTKKSARPSIQSAIINDGISEFSVKVSSLIQRLFEAERIRTEAASSITLEMKKEILDRFLQEYDPKSAIDLVWVFGKENGWLKEAQTIESNIKNGLKLFEVENKAIFKLQVYWHKELFGILSHNGIEWKYDPSPNQTISLIRQTIPGQLPPFISSLLPEGWLRKILKEKDDRETLKTNKRFMSNIAIVANEAELKSIPDDILETPLVKYTLNGFFTGEYKGFTSEIIENSFEENLTNYLKKNYTPKLSGVQIKCPMYLSDNGNLYAADDKPFNYILKPAGTQGFENMPIVEYLTMELAKEVGLKVANTALIKLPDSQKNALLVERFDIRKTKVDTEMLALEDFCSLLDMSPSEKYDGTIEKAGKALRALSTNPAEDIKILFKRALFSWLVADGDMHLKNISVLKTTHNGAKSFDNIRMSPVYDALTTRVFAGLENDNMAIMINGKLSNLNRGDFRKSALNIGIKVNECNDIIEEMALNINAKIEKLGSVIYNKLSPSELETIDKMKNVLTQRVNEI